MPGNSWLRSARDYPARVEFDPQGYSLASDEPPPSPCISVCKMDASRVTDDGTLCAGCLRTIEEIAAWGGASDDVKLEIWRRIVRQRAIDAKAP